MRRVLLALIILPAPALADDGPCFELGGQGIAPCATPGGHVAVETNLVDWTRGRDAGDTVAIAATIARIGVGGSTELRVGGTPLIVSHTPGEPRRTSVGDLTLGAKHQFGGAAPIAVALQITLPTGSQPASQGVWSADLIVPAQFRLSRLFTLDLTGTASAAPNSNADGRHFAAAIVAGADITPSDAVTITTDLKWLRDEEPAGAETRTSLSLAFGWQVGPRTQLTIGGVAGLSSSAPEAEAYAGFGVRF